ncbi:hypothetical protein [Meiothermus sp.]|uniref:hypothetical protein n=1 Tax=Meiothermus sp. TaxID=1955249 RepID=UPI0021DEC40F|nr:hypothetical protein [Meiothermus sp.]GIW33785.1 MAG: hypothetical protein KatS3mg072_1118 [Meiothermus sp.]
MKLNHLTPEITARVPLSVGVRAWIEVTKYRRGSNKPHFYHAQHNLILNKGLDHGLANWGGIIIHPVEIIDYRGFEQMFVYVAVGTGTTAPANNQTGLSNEIARTAANLGLGAGRTRQRLSDGVHRITFTRAFDYSQANGNLTEFGGSHSPNSADGTHTRELFRDGGGNPIVITKTSNERLAITYHFEVTLTPTTETAQGSINLLDNSGNVVLTRLVKGLWIGTEDSPHNDYGGFIGDNNKADRIGHWVTSQASNMTYLDTTSFNGGRYGERLAYTNGNYYRDVEGERGPEANNQNIFAYGLAGFVDWFVSYKIRFVDGSGADNPIAKDKDYRLKLALRMNVQRV